MVEREPCVTMGDGDQVGVLDGLRQAELRQPALPGAEKFAGAPQPQILLGDAKAIFGFAQDAEPRLGCLAERSLIQQQAGRMRFPSTDASTQLVKLGKALADEPV